MPHRRLFKPVSEIGWLSPFFPPTYYGLSKQLSDEVSSESNHAP
jgi:hypothetical protein